ncbi:MAG: YHS domain-containing protein [Candidatus Omnitrophica bacterium]|nr:YHS domain-containing protein [Candidatus Omnitrophota bacterium]
MSDKTIKKIDIEITRTDPVCGMDVSLEKALSKHLFHIYGHKEYIFCSPECLRDFKEDPHKYISEEIYGEMAGMCEYCGKEMRTGEDIATAMIEGEMHKFCCPICASSYVKDCLPGDKND